MKMEEIANIRRIYLEEFVRHLIVWDNSYFQGKAFKNMTEAQLQRLLFIATFSYHDNPMMRIFDDFEISSNRGPLEVNIYHLFRSNKSKLVHIEFPYIRIDKHQLEVIESRGYIAPVKKAVDLMIKRNPELLLKDAWDLMDDIDIMFPIIRYHREIIENGITYEKVWYDQLAKFTLD